MLKALKPLRHRVVAAAPPGMATADAFDAEPCAFECPMFLDCLEGVGRTSGREAAAGRLEGGEDELVKTD